MPSKKPVNLASLESLGVRRLVAIPPELGTADVEIKRRLRIELSVEAGAEAVAGDRRPADA
jgi:hypothetical protein